MSRTRKAIDTLLECAQRLGNHVQKRPGAMGLSKETAAILMHRAVKVAYNLEEGEPWLDNWPTEDGWYWVYGYPWGVFSAGPKLYTLSVNSNEHSRFYAVSGAFVYRSEAGPCKFKKIETPALPELTTEQPVV